MNDLNLAIIVPVLAAVGILAAVIHYFRQPKELRKNYPDTIKPLTKKQRRNRIKWDFIVYSAFFITVIVIDALSD